MSILKRLGMSIVAGACMFIIMSVLYKLFMNNDKWLYDSVLWSIAWAVGHFCARCFVEGIMVNLKAKVIFNVGLIFVTFITVSFITGVIMNIANWGESVAKVLLPFGLATYANSNIIKE